MGPGTLLLSLFTLDEPQTSTYCTVYTPKPQSDKHHVAHTTGMFWDLCIFYVLCPPGPKNIFSFHCLTIWTSACLLMVGQSICLLISTHLSVYPSARFWSQLVWLNLSNITALLYSSKERGWRRMNRDINREIILKNKILKLLLNSGLPDIIKG